MELYNVEIINVNDNSHMTYIAYNLDETGADVVAEKWNESRHRPYYHAQIVPIN